MKTTEFLQVAEKLKTLDIFRVAKKGEHTYYSLGTSCIGSTVAQNTKLWRKYGTLNNILIFKKANEINAILELNNITELKAFPTKSGTMCRLRNEY